MTRQNKTRQGYTVQREKKKQLRKVQSNGMELNDSKSKKKRKAMQSDVKYSIDEWMHE